MRDVIQRVIAAEAEAKHIVEAANTDRERISSDAQEKGQQLVAQARLEARDEADQMVETARLEAEREKQARLACVAADIETQVRLEETAKQRAVEAALRCVCGKRQPT